MDWFYSDNDKQAGPVSESQMDELLRSGIIGRDTLVWRSGMTDWQPLHVARAVPPPAIPPVIPPPASDGTNAACVECRQWFSQSDMVFLHKSWVCAGCKPVFLQRLAEGAAPSPGTGLLWRLKKQIVMRPGTEMPDKCVRCNAPSQGPKLKRELTWHPPAYYILIVVSLLVYIIVAMIIRKKAVIHVGLCDKHRSQRKWAIGICTFGVVVGLGLLIGGGVSENGWMAISGVLLLITGIVWGALKATIVSAAKIDKEFVWVKGACSDYLAELPEWTDVS